MMLNQQILKRQQMTQLFFCKECNRVWEYEFQSARIANKKTSLIYYANFPSYKKNQKVCDYCEKKI